MIIFTSSPPAVGIILDKSESLDAQKDERTDSVSPAPHLIGCLMTISSPILSANYILLMLYDACKSLTHTSLKDLILWLTGQICYR